MTENLSVLLVDDEEELVSALRERMELRGIDAVLALNGQQALHEAEMKKFDVAVIDVMMPEMSGMEVMEQLLKVQPGIKVILLTGRGDENDSAAGLRMGAFDYIIKPVNINVLLDLIRRAVKKNND